MEDNRSIMTRREFGGFTASAALAQAPRHSFRKSICSIIFPESMPVEEKFRQARNAGFAGIEIRLGAETRLASTPDEVKRVGEAARKAGIAISALWVSEGLGDNPLNDASPQVRATGLAAIEKAIDQAVWLGCPALLIISARVGSGPKLRAGYEDSWTRSTAELRKVVPRAQKAKVILGPENVWNKFLVSPLEMRSYIDQFRSPWVQAFFDVGNVMQFGYPQDWILTLGPRIKNVHLKDYKLSTRAEQGRFVNLLQGDVDWKEVVAALKKVGYQGFAGPEYSYDANDPGQLKRLSEETDRILSMA